MGTMITTERARACVRHLTGGGFHDNDLSCCERHERDLNLYFEQRAALEALEPEAEADLSRGLHLTDREMRKGWAIEEINGVKMKVLTREKFLEAIQKP